MPRRSPDPAPAGKRSGWARFWRAYGLAVLFALIMLGIWEFAIWAFHVPKYLLPSPSQIAISLKNDWGPYLAPATWVTLREVLIGFLIAAVAGVGLAIVLHMFTPLRRAVYPLLIGSQTIPIVVLAPILVILFGYGILPKLVIVALICFFPIVVNGLDGLRQVDDDFLRMMKTLDANRWAIFRRVEFPGALPSIFSGMRIAATFAAIGAIFGEWAGASAGLGYVILQATPNLQTARIFAAILILTLIAMALFGLVSLLERIFVPWAPKGAGDVGARSVGAGEGRPRGEPREPERERTGADGSESQTFSRRRRAGVRRHRRRGVQQLVGQQRELVAAGIDVGRDGQRRPGARVAHRGARLGAEPGPRGPVLRAGQGVLRRRGPDDRRSGRRPTPPTRSSSSASTRWTWRSRTSPRCSTASRTACRSSRWPPWSRCR